MHDERGRLPLPLATNVAVPPHVHGPNEEAGRDAPDLANEGYWERLWEAARRAEEPGVIEIAHEQCRIYLEMLAAQAESHCGPFRNHRV